MWLQQQTITEHRHRQWEMMVISDVVIAAHDKEPDHSSYRGLPSIRYALTQHQRAAAGWKALAGNHVFIDTGEAVIALCHLQRDSIAVTPGQHVQTGDVVARCGNSGNSTEPHLHVQAIDNRIVENAHAVSITFNGALPRNGQIIRT